MQFKFFNACYYMHNVEIHHVRRLVSDNYYRCPMPLRVNSVKAKLCFTNDEHHLTVCHFIFMIVSVSRALGLLPL